MLMIKVVHLMDDLFSNIFKKLYLIPNNKFKFVATFFNFGYEA